jgi:Ca2+/Na+ antiporter
MKNIRALFTIIITLVILTLLFLLVLNDEVKFSILFNELTMIILILLFFIIVIFTQFIIYKQTETAHTAQPITKITCQNCKYSEKRSFQTGDYVFKSQGLCLKCGGKMIIEAIYLPSKTKNGSNTVPYQ